MRTGRYIQAVIAMMMLLMYGAGQVFAQVTADDIIIKVMPSGEEGEGSVTAAEGSVTATVDGNRVVTLTISPESGYQTNADLIIAEKMVDPDRLSARRRAPGTGTFDVTGSGSSYSFTIPAEYDGAYVTVTFVPTSTTATQITSLSQITDFTATGNYILVRDIDASGNTSIVSFGGTLEAAINPTTHMPYKIYNLSKPLFTTLTGTVKNLVLEDVSISGNSGNTGAIACTANGAARIYNVGILSGSVGGTGDTGGLVGLLDGTARVVNCYSYAEITNGDNVGGIVGNNNYASKASDIKTMVMNCMFYGDITGGSTKSPVYGGTNIANLQGGLNTFNYYAYEQLPTSHISDNKYNSALAVEEKFLNRFEFYRLLLNSNKKLAAFYVTGNVADANQMLKWVLETADRTIDNPKPYPVLKEQGYYPSIINYDTRNLANYSEENRNKGLKTGTLSVTINSVGSNAPSGAAINNGSVTLTLTRTDKDFDRFNFNYDKVQLPYYNDIGEGNYTGNRVVTGWKITAITAIDGDPYTAANYPTTGIRDYPDHNYADRKSSQKDLYSVSKRVFSQGAYFDVPYGVTSITIEPYWGKAVYLADKNYDVVYKADYSGKQDVSQTGTQLVRDGATPTTFNGQKAETSIENALNYIKNNLDGEGSTVYDNALVLMGNYHLDGVPLNGSRPFTMMSVDTDNDHEPDYSLIYHHKSRTNITPIRFDFLNIPGTAQAQKPNGASLICNFTIVKTRGWFEITNTALVHSDQLEYENGDLGNGVTKIDAPLILLGGVFDQFVSTQSSTVNGHTIYIHVGGNVWINEFGMGTHSDGSQSTPHVPVSVTGGEFPGFYLTGTYKADAAVRSDNAECYISGGYIHEAAGASLEQINGNVRWQIYNADIDNFYGGGINDAKPITGDVTVDIYNSHVTTYCGGPKFGNMQAGKKVTTHAEGCVFGKYFGAGFGGTSLSKKKYYDKNDNPVNWTNQQKNYTNDRGKYFDGGTSGLGSGTPPQYGYKGPGVATDFDYEFFVWSSGTTGGRFYVKFAAFSLAQCNAVESKLKGCTIENNFYGGGSLGKVVGTVTSELEDCVVKGNVFGAGYSASLPTLEVRDAGFTQNPNYNSASGMFEPGVFSGTTTFEWKNATEAGVILTNNNSGSDLTNHYVYTDVDLSKTNLGSVDGDVNLTIKGRSVIGTAGNTATGNVYGGGDESSVIGDNHTITVTLEGDAEVLGNVFGGGNEGDVASDVELEITGNPIVHRDVYGGGALANVNTTASDHTYVNLTGGTVNGDVYGGGLGDASHAAMVHGAVQVNIGAAPVAPSTTPTGNATIGGSVYGCNNVYGSPQANVLVNIYKTAHTTDNAYPSGITTLEGLNGLSNADNKFAIKAVYGGGNKAAYTPPANDPAHSTTVHVYGCSENTIKIVYGGGNAADVGTSSVSANTNVIIEGGRFDIIFGGGNGYSETNNHSDPTAPNYNPGANIYGTATTEIQGGLFNQVFGGSNQYGNVTATNLTINKLCDDLLINESFGGANEADITGNVTTTLACGDNINIGTFYGGSNKANITGNVTLNVEGGTYINVFGGSKGVADDPATNDDESISADISGNVTLNLFGGTMDNAFGGSDVNGLIGGKITVNMLNKGVANCGLVVHNIYGGGRDAAYTPTTPGAYPEINLIHGSVTKKDGGDGTDGNVFGGGKGAGATVTSNPTIYVGYDTSMATRLSTLPGITSLTNSTVSVAGNVYGGGDLAAVTGSISVTMQQHTAEGFTSGSTVGGNMYGGGNLANVTGDVTVNMTGGTVNHDVYGGGALANTNTANWDDTKNSGAGGWADGKYVASTGTTHKTLVNLTGGTIEGNAYGGGLGDATHPALVMGDVSVKLNGTKLVTGYTTGENPVLNAGRVFGCNNVNGTPLGHVKVLVQKTSEVTSQPIDVAAVFGGGNLANYEPANANDYAEVEVNKPSGEGQRVIVGNVYGGGNEAGVGNSTTVAGTLVNIVAGDVKTGVYGGCNTSGTVSGNIVVNLTGGQVGTSTAHANVHGGGYGSATATSGNVDVNMGASGTPNTGTAVIYGDVYGGSALGNVNSGTEDYTHVNLYAGTIYGDAYGGGLGDASNAALVNGNVTVTQNGVVFVKATTTDDLGNTVVTAGRIFGCNNLNGSPRGTVLVLVNKTARADGNAHAKSVYDADGNITTNNYEMNAVYGGGNLAAYDPANPEANGQYNTNHDATKKPLQVIINGCDEASIEYVYGGGNAAPTPSTDVLILGSYELGYVFGGGNGKDQFTLDGGTNWNTNPGADVGIKNSTNYGTGIATTRIYGGTIHEAYGGSNQKGTIVGTADIDAEDGGSCTLDLGKMVGAGKNADIDGDVVMTLGCKPTTKIPLLFAGADNANVDGNVELTITSGNFGQVFGGNNLGGIIKGHLKVNIEETGTCSTPINIDELYLGGNEAAYSRYGYYADGTLPDGRTKYSPRTSATDSHTAVTGNHSAPYDEPVMNVISCTYIGNVFGGGLGEGAAMYANPTVNINMIKGSFADNTTIGVPAKMNELHLSSLENTIHLGIIGNVYGGGNEAAVYGNTKVNIATASTVDLVSTSTTGVSVLGAYISGTVYGGGRGNATKPGAAIVTGNTQVNMAGGQVNRSIYGGGELSSVGTFTEYYTTTSGNDTDADYHVKGEPKTCADDTGLTEVKISGGRVGLVNQLMPDPDKPTSDDDYGYVFCASKGMADPTETNTDGVPYANLLAVSGSSYLEISGTALIAASVYGGSENGQVLGDTHVKIMGGQIGSGHYKEGGVDKWDDPYTDAQWTAAINAIKSGVAADINTAVAVFHECDAWPFGAEGSRHVYDHYAEYGVDEDGDGTDDKYYYDAAHTKPAYGGSKSGSDGHSFYGHVFGGGSGYYPYAPGKWRRTDGRVCGNTLVEITGGHILTNVYGGNEITDVLGHSKVVMTGGTVGVPRTVAGIQARPVNSYIFGAGMGDPRVLFNGWSNVGSSEVIVDEDAVVFGSVFGGGEDGHVLGNSSTTIKGNALIGTFGTSGVDGNIFGSGRGFSALALTAGVICGNITVNIEGNAKILGSVYGGGRLAAVGTYLAGEETGNYGKLIPEGADPYGTGSTTHGNVTINITGGTIGTLTGINSVHDYSVGDVFGGSKGTLMDDWAKSQKLGLVKNTTVNISQASGSTTTIYGNVYGGGEIASVGSYSYYTSAQASDYNNSLTNPAEPVAEGDVNQLIEANAGKATILITGGTIGQNSVSDTHGHVFGGCLGRAGTGYSGYSFVDNSDVTLNGGTVYGSIFGGGENGHMLHDTDVKILSGTVGIRMDNAASLDNNMIYKGNVYGGGRGIDTYNDGSVNTYSITAGKVAGNTNVTVEGGTVYRNVYGGGSLASVGIRDKNTTTDGLATVIIKGGTIGSDGGAAANDYSTGTFIREYRRENGYVYGSGRGMSAGQNSSSTLVDLAYAKNTIVSIEGTANVTGSVFGGGENGHVKHDTKVYVKENCFVGTELSHDEHAIDDNGRGRLIYRANVYGGGRGIDEGGDHKLSFTAGRVYGNAYVYVSGGKIYHDVFGGGSLASVGNETVNATTGEVTYGDDSGLAEVHISGGIVGYSSTAADQGFNCGFVYGGCRGLAASATSDLVKMAYVHNAKVYIEPGADIKGSVFGGGANGHVKNDTYVSITGGSIGTALRDDKNEAYLDDHGVAEKPIFRGNVYAGGRGVDQYNVSEGDDRYSLSAGAVYGNATLVMTGGHVWHNIYGSGAMASVGTVEAKAAGTHVHDEVVDNNGDLVNNVIYNPDESDINYLTGVFKANTGKVTMTITGGTVGDTTPGHEGINNGNVFGAGRGVSANRSDYVASMEFVDNTEVTIGTSGQTSYTGSDPEGLNYPYIYGNVYGGGENGHVKNDTRVKIYSGIIGYPLVEGNGQKYKEAADGSAKNPYRGHVFGGGCGVDPLYHGSTETRSSTAGRVYGHTFVTMTGGVVRRAIYGGGLLASVGVYRLLQSDMHIIDMIEDPGQEIDAGDATITISGGYVGNVNPDGTAVSVTGALVPGDNNGHVFGSSCGMVADNYVEGGQQVDIQYRQMGYSHSTHVNISGDNTRIFGCVFGSGENGHVWEDAKINITGGTIGSQENTSIYVGNVYGSGRGVDHPHEHISETAGKVRGNTIVNVTGGTIWRDVYGGGSLASVGEADETANDSKIAVTSDPTTTNPFPYSSGLTRVVIDGTAAVHGSVYGSGRGVASTNTEYKQAAYVKNTLVTVKGNARIYNNVFGGGNAGHVRRNTNVTIDGTAKVDGNVYGGGAGDISSPTAGIVDHDVVVNIKGGVIGKDVYGGGAIANTNVHDVRNTTVTDCYDTNRVNAKTEVNLTGGIILGDAYGGGQGVIPGSGATAAQIANAAALVQGDVTVTLNGTAFVLTTTKDDQGNDVPASGRVFGCNNLNGTPQGTVLVHVLKTLGVTASGTAPNVTYTVNDVDDKPTKDTDEYEVEAVYGGGNLAAYEPWDANATGQYSDGVLATKNPLQVVIDGCELTSIHYVYGGGNAASVPVAQVAVKGTYEIGTVFGGGNGKDKYTLDGGTTWRNNEGAHVGYKADGTTPYANDVYGDVNVYLFGGTIHNAFGGSNTLGNIKGTAEMHINEAMNGSGNPICPLILDELYGGGNEAYMAGGSEIDMGCITSLKAIYGGAKKANVGGDVVLTITSGTFDRVFGGNNISGTISGSITVNIEETGCHPIIIGELYGCGNQAPYTTPGNKHPTINVRSFTSIGRIFGGGLGTDAIVTGNPTVNIDEIKGDYAGSAYAGETKIIDGTSVILPNHAANAIGAIGTVFGGGNAAKVVGNTNVNIGTQTTIKYTSDAAEAAGRPVLGVDIRNNVYGGGNKAEVTGNTNVLIGK